MNDGQARTDGTSPTRAQDAPEPTAAQEAPDPGAREPEGTRSKPGVSRRGFVAGTCGVAAMLALGTVSLVPSTSVCRPPGAQDEDRFSRLCIRCQKCAETCPNGVIVPTHLEDGIVAFRTPRLDYSQASNRLSGALGWCDHCEIENGGVPKCAAVCPTGAIEEKADSTFQTMRVGLAVLENDLCLAWRLKGCTVCLNACPLSAIYFDDNNRPWVEEALCNGCGSCEQACVSLEGVSLGEGDNKRDTAKRAITVEPFDSAAVSQSRA